MTEFRKWVNICGSYGQEFSVLFLTHGVDGARGIMCSGGPSVCACVRECVRSDGDISDRLIAVDLN